MRILAGLFLGLALPLAPACAQPQASPPDLILVTPDSDAARLEAAFDDLVAHGFTGYVTVSIAGQPVYARGQNSAQQTFGLDTPVDILSMTKSLTGAAVARLIVEERLSPDTTLAELFAGVPADKAGITVHQLLTHAAGLPHGLGEDHEYIDRDAYLARTWAAPLSFEPGSRYDYSNVGYSLLAAIIEQVTGQSYDDYLRETIFTPAGMSATGFESACCDRPGSARVTDISWGGERASWHLIGNGGMLSTPRDMMLWIEAYESGRLGAGVRALTHQPWQIEGEGAASHYGYGLVVEDHPRFGRTYWHNGGSRAYNGHWRYYAEHGVAIFVTSDQWEISSDRAEAAIARTLFEGAGK